MLVGVLLAVAHLAPPLSAQPLFNADDSKRDTNAAEEINHAQDVKTDLNTKTGNLEMKEQNTINLDESDRGVVSDEKKRKEVFPASKRLWSAFL